jgi:hypothetical protein
MDRSGQCGSFRERMGHVGALRETGRCPISGLNDQPVSPDPYPGAAAILEQQ